MTDESETDPNSDNVIRDLKGAQLVEDRLRIWQALIKHFVTIWLVISTTVFSPVGLALLLWISPDDAVEDILRFHEKWFSTMAGLTGAALGAYFMTSMQRK